MNCNKYDFDVVVCIKDSLNVFKICLDNILCNTIGKFKLILVNDNSDYDTYEYLSIISSCHKNISLITNNITLGYTKSLNIGLKHVESEYVFILNSDIIVTKNWNLRMLNPLINNYKIAISGPLSNAASWQSIPKIFDKLGNYKINELPPSYSIDSFDSYIHKAYSGSFTEVYFVNGFCMCLRSKLFKEIGLFDEINFPIGYGEETDFCLRTNQFGYMIVVVLDTYIFHFKSSSFGHEYRKKLTLSGKLSLYKKYGISYIDNLYYKMKYHDKLNIVRNQINKLYCE